MSALDDLNDLISSLPGYSSITTGMKNTALAGSVLPDSNGVWPGEDGYVTTYDIYFAAYSLVGFLKARPIVTSSSSEGTSVTVQAPDWDSLLVYYRSMSPILSATGGVLTPVPIPDWPHVSKVSMRGDGGYGSGIDTDLS